MDVCRNCRGPLASTARFCPTCGVPAPQASGPPTLDGRRLTDSTAGDGALAPVRARGPDRSGDGRSTSTREVDRPAWWSSARHRSLVAVTACGILLGAAVGLAFAGGGRFDSGAAPSSLSRSTRPSTSQPRPRSATKPAAGGDEGPRAFVHALETIVQLAATGHAQLVSALTGVQSDCPGTAVTASQEIESVMANRTTALRALEVLPAAPNPQTGAVRDLLAQALQASAVADGHYAAWAASLDDATSSGCESSTGGSTAEYQAARAADVTATTFKNDFVAAFNPLAASFGFTTWSPSAF